MLQPLEASAFSSSALTATFGFTSLFVEVQLRNTNYDQFKVQLWLQTCNHFQKSWSE
jgi:hypothetical protein